MYNGTFEKDENSQFSIWRIVSLLFCFKNIFIASPSDLLLFRLFFEAHARAAF
jgi:hypothetical protein